MGKWGKYTYILRYFMYLSFLYDIISRNMGNTRHMIIFSLLFLCIAINDHIRFNYLHRTSAKIFYTSILISMLISTVLKIFVGGYIDTYLYISIIDIAFIRDKKAVKYLGTLNILIIILLPFLQVIIFEKVGILQFFKEGFFEYLMLGMYLFFYTTSIFYYRALIIEKNRVEKLNKEIEELTITKERNRVAQEIHDNLGHSLIALNMNLDVANNMLYKDEDITKEIIEKCQRLTKDSMYSLRKAVYALKDENISKGLIKAIEKLVCSIDDSSKINTNHNIDERIENYSPEYKNIIYTTIKESMTNSIKHGGCNEIQIDIKVKDKIYLTMKDDGIGCSDVIKGNGLQGIEERIIKVGGQVEYITKKGEGFETVVILPK